MAPQLESAATVGEKRNDYLLPVHHGDLDQNLHEPDDPPVRTEATTDNRGRRPGKGCGVVTGSGVTVGGGCSVEDYDKDTASGGGKDVANGG